jgi:hypothetical protein
VAKAECEEALLRQFAVNQSTGTADVWNDLRCAIGRLEAAVRADACAWESMTMWRGTNLGLLADEEEGKI